MTIAEHTDATFRLLALHKAAMILLRCKRDCGNTEGRRILDRAAEYIAAEILQNKERMG